MTELCFLYSRAYAIVHHSQFLQMLTGNRRTLSRATKELRHYNPGVQVFMRQREACSHQFDFLTPKKI